MLKPNTKQNPAPAPAPAPESAGNNSDTHIPEHIRRLIDVEVKQKTHPEQIKLKISEFIETPNLIFKWVQEVKNRDSKIGYFWGFGDILRGMISMYQYCKQHRCNFRVDISSHPLSNYFDTSSNTIFVEDTTNNTNFYGVDGGVFNTLHIPKVNGCQVFCNVWPLTPLTSDEKQLIPSILKIKPAYIIELPKHYNVFHLRFNDKEIHTEVLTDEMDRAIKYVKTLYKPGDILCSNVSLVKRTAKYIYDMESYNEDISGSHIGYEAAGKAHDSMIVDFQIISNAETVYTYSSYIWISGFVQWAALCYGKKLIDMKKEISPIE